MTKEKEKAISKFFLVKKITAIWQW